MHHARWLSIYLFLCCALVFLMTVAGGITRLSGAGLSMVEWRPLLGVVPPLSEAEWARVFRQYQQFPEYFARPVDLAGFQRIFWIEYAHRLLGRITAFIFAAPFLFFLLRGWLGWRLATQLVLLFALGGAQGVLGWYMVQSGLVDVPTVSPLRLTAHLFLALVLFAWLLWLALTLRSGRAGCDTRKNAGDAWDCSLQRRWNGQALCAGLFVLWLFVVCLSGALVAGARAGFVYNTFPLMDGYLVPPAVFAMEPLWLNFTQNAATIQFVHRLLAVITLLFAAGLFYTLRRAVYAWWPLAVVTLQAMLGIATLLQQTPLALAVAHQSMALLLLGIAVYTLYRTMHISQ